MSKRALIVPASTQFACEVENIDTDLQSLQKIVGGWIEAVSPVDGKWHAYVDEEGKIKDGMRFNPRATLLAHELGWPMGDIIYGPAVFLGDGRDGEEADVPGVVIATAKNMGCEVREAQ